MTTASPASITATELSRKIVDAVSRACATTSDAETARATLAEILSNQNREAGIDLPEAAAEAGPAAASSALTCEAREFARPNGEMYRVRKLGEHDDIAAMRKAREVGINVLAYGPPGTGKTALIEAAYAGEGGVWTVQGSGDTEVADFIGGYTQMPGGVFEWVDGPLLRAMEAGGVLYVDEVALIDPKVLAMLYGVMDGRGEYNVTQNPERGVVKAAAGFFIVSACNPNAPGARMSEALVSRFALQFEVTTDFPLCRKLGVPSKAVSAAQNLNKKLETGEVGWAPQMREMLAFRDMSKHFGEKFALANLVAGSPEIDRSVVADVFSRTFTEPVAALRMS